MEGSTSSTERGPGHLTPRGPGVRVMTVTNKKCGIEVEHVVVVRTKAHLNITQQAAATSCLLLATRNFFKKRRKFCERISIQYMYAILDSSWTSYTNGVKSNPRTISINKKLYFAIICRNRTKKSVWPQRGQIPSPISPNTTTTKRFFRFSFAPKLFIIFIALKNNQILKKIFLLTFDLVKLNVEYRVYVYR